MMMVTMAVVAMAMYGKKETNIQREKDNNCYRKRKIYTYGVHLISGYSFIKSICAKSSALKNPIGPA